MLTQINDHKQNGLFLLPNCQSFCDSFKSILLSFANKENLNITNIVDIEKFKKVDIYFNGKKKRVNIDKNRNAISIINQLKKLI